MFFDHLAGIVERHMPMFLPMMVKARIFRMEPCPPKNSMEIVSQWLPDERTIENFRLPFPIIAIEASPQRDASGGNCVLFSVKNATTRELDFLYGHRSLGPAFLASGSLIALPDVEQIIEASEYQRVAKLTSIMRFWEGDKKSGMRELPSKLDVQASMEISRTGKPSPDTINFSKMTEEQKKALVEKLRKESRCLEAEASFLGCCIGVLEVLVINEPACFVVEERSLQEPRELPKTIRRSADRPHYIVLKPRQIRERFLWPDNRTKEEKEESEDDRHKVTPHERRGHFRRLQSERFVKARGQVIWIEPMWIGPSEAVKGNNKYKVRLDL